MTGPLGCGSTSFNAAPSPADNLNVARSEPSKECDVATGRGQQDECHGPAETGSRGGQEAAGGNQRHHGAGGDEACGAAAEDCPGTGSPYHTGGRGHLRHRGAGGEEASGAAPEDCPGTGSPYHP